MHRKPFVAACSRGGAAARCPTLRRSAVVTNGVLDLGETGRIEEIQLLDRNLWLATRNLPDIFCLYAAEVDPLSLVGSDRIIMTAAATKLIEERIG